MRTPTALICVAMVAGMCLTVSCTRKQELPAGMIGAWVADPGSKYKGASFDISDKSITFRRGVSHVDRNTIVGVEAGEHTSEYKAYEIKYRNFSGSIQTLSLRYFPARGEGEIRFLYQQDIVWRPKKAR